jgi:threonine dehydrogenase-like Zn-dependent dehydrogenase
VFRKGLSIFATYASPRNSPQALVLIASGRVRVNDLVSRRLPLSGFEKGIHAIESKERKSHEGYGFS